MQNSVNQLYPGRYFRRHTRQMRAGRGVVPAMILKTATQIAARDGVAAMSLREVQKLSGHSQNALFKHWRGKAEFTAAMADALGVYVHGEVEKAVAGCRGGAMHKLFAALDRQIRLAHGFPVCAGVPSSKNVISGAAATTNSAMDAALAVHGVYRELAQSIAREAGRPEVAVSIGTALAAVAEAFALEAGRRCRLFPPEVFVQGAQWTANSLLRGAFMPG